MCDAGTSCVFLNDYYSQCQPGAATSQAPPPPPPAQPTSTAGGAAPAATGLDAAIKRKGKVYWGTAADQNRFSNAQDSAVTIAQFGQLTPENSMKWDATESTHAFLWPSMMQVLTAWVLSRHARCLYVQRR